MQRNSILVSTLFLLQCFFNALQAQQPVKTSGDTVLLVQGKLKADSVWKSFEFKPPTIEELTKSAGNLIEATANRELRNRRYREDGISFWKKFPNDIRRFEWLENTLKRNQFPFYWKDVRHSAMAVENNNNYNLSIDQDAILSWEKIYPFLRKEYLSSPRVSNDRKINFKCWELEYYMWKGRNPQYRDICKFDLMHLKDLFISAASDFWAKYSEEKYESTYNPFGRINVFLFNHKDDYDLTVDDLVGFVRSVKSSTQGRLKDWADAKERYLSLYTGPLDLVFTSIDGNEIDLQKYRGKVVVLDFWATWCPSCIAMMPRLKELHDKYKDQGFEVISITLDHEDKMDAIMKVEHKVGASWPIVVIGGKNKEDEVNSVYRKLWDKYAFTGIPIILTFNKKGYLVEELGGFTAKDYEAKLVKLLKE